MTRCAEVSRWCRTPGEGSEAASPRLYLECTRMHVFTYGTLMLPEVMAAVTAGRFL